MRNHLSLMTDFRSYYADPANDVATGQTVVTECATSLHRFMNAYNYQACKRNSSSYIKMLIGSEDISVTLHAGDKAIQDLKLTVSFSRASGQLGLSINDEPLQPYSLTDESVADLRWDLFKPLVTQGERFLPMREVDPRMTTEDRRMFDKMVSQTQMKLEA